MIDLCESKGWLKLNQLRKTPRTPRTPRTREYSTNELLKPVAASRVLRVAPKTLAQWRVSGRGPVFSKVGRMVVYRYADLIKYASQNSRLSTSEKGRDQ